MNFTNLHHFCLKFYPASVAIFIGMKVFVTGASGYIGSHLVRELSAEGHDVTVLVRDIKAFRGSGNDGMKIIKGDISDPDSLKFGMEGCNWVFHLAAYAKPTSTDRNLPYRVNVEGTINVLRAADATGVKRVVVTSTGGTMGCSLDGKPVDEQTISTTDYHTDYERTKAEAEKIAMAASTNERQVIVVNPTRVFGPGKLSKSNAITRIMKLYCNGLWRIIPGDGSSIGNYSFIRDVVKGHILAAKYGKGGERYILGGENVSFGNLFETLGKVNGTKRKMITTTERSLKNIARITGAISGIVGKPPLISDSWIEKYLQNWILSSEKAIRGLSYTITPFEDALGITVRWIKSGRDEQ